MWTLKERENKMIRFFQKLRLSNSQRMILDFIAKHPNAAEYRTTENNYYRWHIYNITDSDFSLFANIRESREWPRKPGFVEYSFKCNRQTNCREKNCLLHNPKGLHKEACLEFEDEARFPLQVYNELVANYNNKIQSRTVMCPIK